ncbi:MAG: hypothetical protein AAFP76_10625 [Bacteroidota bacterium]
MKRNTLLYIIIGLLIGINGFLWFHQFKKKSHRRGNDPAVFIAKELDFDASQEADYKALSEPHKERMKKFHGRSRELKDVLFKLMFEESVVQAQRDSLLQEIANVSQAREAEVFNHFRQVREICTESQRKKLEKIVAQARPRNVRKPR